MAISAKLHFGCTIEKEENLGELPARRAAVSPARYAVDRGQVDTDYLTGVLRISLAKKAEAKLKQIKVNVGSEKTLETKAHDKPLRASR